ncbi:transposase [Streptomyces sp. NBC_01511]
MLSRLRTDFYDCLTARADALFEPADAALCTDGPVRSSVDLALAPEHRRGHGALHADLNRGRMDVVRLRRALAGAPLPRAAGGRLVVAVDVSPCLRPDAGTVPDRSFCQHLRPRQRQASDDARPAVLGRRRPGDRPHFVVRAPGRGPAGPRRRPCRHRQPGPRGVQRLVAAGQWVAGDPEILIVLDAGYDAPRIAHPLSDPPVEILGRTRSDRVMRRPTPPRVYDPKGGRPPKHGGEFVFAAPATWGEEQAATVTDTRLYGKATARAWDRPHPRLISRAARLDHDGPLPIIEGTVIRLAVEHLPSGGVNKPVWLWWSRTGATPADVNRCRQAFLRRSDIEHTFRMLKQTLGWTRPRLRDSAAADRWTWLIVAAHTQLRLARPLATDLRRPWKSPTHRTSSPHPASGAGSGTSAQQPARRPVHRNPPLRARDTRRARRTDDLQPVTTWDESSPAARHTSDRLTTRPVPNPTDHASSKLTADRPCTTTV